MSLSKEIVINNNYIHVTLIRGKGTNEPQVCQYQIKVEDEGLIVDSVEENELVALDAYDHVFLPCPECENSHEPGWHYNNADPAAQRVSCGTCNPGSDPVPAYPEDVI